MIGIDGGDSTRVFPSLVNSCEFALARQIRVTVHPHCARSADGAAAGAANRERLILILANRMSASSTTACSGRSTVRFDNAAAATIPRRGIRLAGQALSV